MTPINEIPLDFILKNLASNTIQSIEVKYELIKRVENVGRKKRCITPICNKFSNELFKKGINYSPSTLRMMYYR